MIILPKECEVNKIIPKKIFYEKINISSSVKKEFVQKIEKIYWKYKISEDNINISKTDEIEEIEVFEITLKEKTIINNILKIISKEIPYPILFKIIYNLETMYALNFEENIFKSEWNEEADFYIKGFDLKSVYENFVRQINNITSNNKIKEEIDKIKEKEQLQKEIQKLENIIKKEKQFNIKIEYNKELNAKKNKLKELVENG